MFTFRKNERLSGFRLRKLLFTRGKQEFIYPFRVRYMSFTEEELSELGSDKMPLPRSARFQYPAKCLVSVSRHNFRKASGRNRIKRLIKEAYRKNKTPFYAFLKDKGVYCMLALIYVGKREPGYLETENSIKEVLNRLMLILEKDRECKGSN